MLNALTVIHGYHGTQFSLILVNNHVSFVSISLCFPVRLFIQETFLVKQYLLESQIQVGKPVPREQKYSKEQIFFKSHFTKLIIKYSNIMSVDIVLNKYVRDTVL